MKIKWMGHSCFVITSDDGARIVTDPYDDTVGYGRLQLDGDIVTSSHDHFDHNYIKGVNGKYELFNKPGQYSCKGVSIKGIPTYHDQSEGAKRGSNIVFCLGVDGINICHCGDLGHVLSDEQVAEIGSVDVLLLPVGGTFTVDAREAYEVFKQLKPKVTIPMHFQTDALKFGIDGVDKFLDIAGGGNRAGKQEIEIKKEELDEYPSIIVLEYK